MTDEQMAARFDRLEAGLTARFDQMDGRFEKPELRMEHMEKSAVTRTDLFQGVIVAQGLFHAGVLGPVAVLNAVGAFG
jgi:hypothetical protein